MEYVIVILTAEKKNIRGNGCHIQSDINQEMEVSENSVDTIGHNSDNSELKMKCLAGSVVRP